MGAVFFLILCAAGLLFVMEVLVGAPCVPHEGGAHPALCAAGGKIPAREFLGRALPLFFLAIGAPLLFASLVAGGALIVLAAAGYLFLGRRVGGR